VGRFADAWTSLYVLIAAWLPVLWFVDHTRTRAVWEFRELFGALSMHDLAYGVLAVHALFIMVRFGIIARR
jgi:hypothetical protein